jgi:hypothetical protein
MPLRLEQRHTDSGGLVSLLNAERGKTHFVVAVAGREGRCGKEHPAQGGVRKRAALAGCRQRELLPSLRLF